jgi:hypothetical protein
MSGHGFKLAPAVGDLKADLITGACPPVSVDPFLLGPFAAASAGGRLTRRTSTDKPRVDVGAGALLDQPLPGRISFPSGAGALEGPGPPRSSST